MSARVKIVLATVVGAVVGALVGVGVYRAFNHMLP